MKDCSKKTLRGGAFYTSSDVPGLAGLRTVYMRLGAPELQDQFVMLLAMPEAFADDDMRNFRSLLTIIFFAIILLTGATAMFLVHKALRPIRAITAEAENIGPENLTARLRDPGTGEEFSRLVAVFNGLLTRLESVFDAQRRFTALAAHELRTPLTILKGETQVILRSRRTAKEYEETLRSSLEEIDKLVSGIDDMMLMTRYEGGEAEIPRDPVVMAEVVQSVVNDLGPLASARGVRLELATHDRCSVLGDRHALERLVYKLIENALFYTRPEGSVSVRLIEAGDRVHLTVEDTGVGIKPEDLPHIFERFYRSPAARSMRPEGVGIGLATAAVIANLHGASIDVKSEEGRGTVLAVRFRLTPKWR